MHTNNMRMPRSLLLTLVISILFATESSLVQAQESPCYVCGSSFRYIADPDTPFQITDAAGNTETWTCGFLEDVAVSSVSASDTDTCNALTAYADTQCQCAGRAAQRPALPCVNICGVGRYVPPNKANIVVDSGFAGRYPCATLHNLALNNWFPDSACSSMHASLEDTCCGILPLDCTFGVDCPGTVVAVGDAGELPSSTPSEEPSSAPSQGHSESPSSAPSQEHSESPSSAPSQEHSESPSSTLPEESSESPSSAPSEESSEFPSSAPSVESSTTPTSAFPEGTGDAPLLEPTQCRDLHQVCDAENPCCSRYECKVRTFGTVTVCSSTGTLRARQSVSNRIRGGAGGRNRAVAANGNNSG